MTTTFETPQDAEDAFYDALEEKDLEGLMAVWEESDNIGCILPMSPVLEGREKVREGFRPMIESDVQVDIEIHHRLWIEHTDFAVHMIEERVKIQGAPRAQPPLFATNIYRRNADGWRMVLHQNSPAPPPPGMTPPGLNIPGM